jgi:hypothetical protein
MIAGGNSDMQFYGTAYTDTAMTGCGEVKYEA